MVLKNCGASKNPKKMCTPQDFTFQATTTLQGDWGLTRGRTANTPAKSDGPKSQFVRVLSEIQIWVF